MKALWVIAGVYFAEWIASSYVQDQWTFFLGSKYLLTAIALALAAVLSFSAKKTIAFRSAITLFAFGAWLDFAKYLLWNATNYRLNISVPLAIFFLAWAVHVMSRSYRLPNAIVNPANICILIHKPKGIFGVIKSLIFFPADSICLYANDNVWAFHRGLGIFDWSRYNEKFWAESHFIIDTGIQCNLLVISELNKIVGERRFPYCKCVWAIRHALNKIGSRYSIQHWWEYFPPLYLSRILQDE